MRPTALIACLASLCLILPLPCAHAQAPAGVSAPAAAPVPAPLPAVDPAFARCLAAIQPRAAARGIDAAAFARLTADLRPDPTVLPLLDAQPEFTTPIWDYLAGLVDGQRVADGQAMLAAHAGLLARLEGQYGVDPATVVAVWGVESDYGRITGSRPLRTSLATLACAGRRQEFFRGELLSLLLLLHSGDLADPGLTGSWAGAFGQTQFIPSTYARVAVDGDGDGRRDLVGSTADALASTARYLQLAGWKSGRPWGWEVKLPAGFDPALAGRSKRRPLADWVARGIVRADGSVIAPAQEPTALLLPAGAKGPAFLVSGNYDAIYAYNAAESYALAIATLADRLRGSPGLVAAWPTDDPGLPRAQRRELQTLLLARGHAIGTADGLVGSATRRAIVAEQQRLGRQPADGRAGLGILQALRAEAAPRPTAFVLPPDFARWQQSPSPTTARTLKTMHDVPGLSLGTFQGLDALLVETPHATAAVALFGGQLLSFVPAGGQEVMWLSPQRAALPTPIRGGTPVCWPYFGRQGQGNEVPAHGLVRTLPWQLTAARREADGTMVLDLEPPVLESLVLKLRMQLRVGKVLEQRLFTENTGSAPVVFTEALHNYFNVADATAVRIEGLDGLTYLDKNDGMAAHVQQGDWTLLDPRDPGRSDRMFGQAGGHYRLVDPGLGRRITLTVAGGRSAIVWNPGEAAAANMADVGPHWRRFVCLEAANAGPDVVELAPGAKHALVQVIAVTPL
ncbi:lytic murein transglycosylase [Pseudoxanthomonas sp.]|uniref:lytic murein transglycosylase n=1 Tax=Pseudoxanthomonas sp. TaxID=1871049 RepID=UPI00258B9349|nr:lytic murein transglycosylase [Pseudoxanthomonas sp.]MCR6686183.1 lytic murein transglycosylase [Pseudoxanthomonas sp.]